MSDGTNEGGGTAPGGASGDMPGGLPDGVSTEGPDDEALARLRAADPAGDVPTRSGVLRAKVGALVGDEDAAADGPAAVGGRTVGGTTAVGGADELAARRGARHRTPWLAAAAVVVVAAVGVGGFALGSVPGAGSGAGDTAAGAAEPAIVLNGGGSRGGPESAAGGATADGATGASGGAAAEDSAGLSAAGSTSSDMAYPSWYSGRALFHASGLSTEGGTAEAYAFDATQVATRDGAARAAKELGVEGEPRWEYGSWAVGPRDGDGPTLWLSVDGSATFSFNDPAADPWQCAEVPARSAEDGDPDEGVECPDQTATSTVSERAARRALQDVMERLGVDPGGFELEVGEEAEGEPARWVTAHLVVDGSRTGAQWSATVGEAGIAWLDGFLAPTTDLGDYPVISAADAVERLGDPRFSQAMWPVTYAESTEAAMEEQYEEPTEPTPAPAPPSAGDPVDWPVSDVEITDARLGLAQQYQDDGTVVLVPAYELSDADGNAWSVVAVADDAMDFTATR